MLEQADSHRGAGRPSSDRDDHTVVIGGSVAGLVAARVLVDHFEQVRLSAVWSLPRAPAFSGYARLVRWCSRPDPTRSARRRRRRLAA